MKIFIALFFLAYSVQLVGQNKQDYVWLFSSDTELTEGNEAYGFNFNQNENLNSLQGVVPIQMLGVNASISDHDGNLLFYSNGCQVVGSNHEVLPNGSNLNKGDYYEMIGDSCFSGYVGKQDILILPDPGNVNGFYLLNKAVHRLNQFFFRDLRYSYIDKSLNDGFGDVIIKNNSLHDSIRFMSRYLTAINHSNGKDWWIMQPLELSNGYLIMLLDENGFSKNNIQHIGPDLHWNASASGTAVFSPDGTKYAYFNKDDNLLLYNFDRNTGRLSNLKQVDIYDGDPYAFFSSVEFSPDSRFMYFSLQDSLWQLDTYEQNLNDGKELIAVWDGTNDPFATTFTLMALAPNCKIYICSGSSTNTYHVINKPNEKGSACDFVQRGIQLPHTSSLANMPNFPRFRVDDDEKCDPTITSVFGAGVIYRRDLRIYPNPSFGDVFIEIPDGQDGFISVYDLNGKQIMEPIEVNGVMEKQIGFSHLPDGSYFVEFVSKDPSKNIVWNSKVSFVK